MVRFSRWSIDALRCRALAAQRQEKAILMTLASSLLDYSRADSLHIAGNFPLEAVIPFEINSPVAQQSQQQQQAVYPNFTSQQTLPLPPFQPTSPSTSAAAAYPGYPPQPKQPQSTAAANQVSPSESADPARALAEEDKRRRNTAASARFRVKKKQREQALEQKTQELEKAKQALEQRVGQLETENEWLRGLVVEKNGGVGGGGPSSVKKTQKVSDSEANGAKKGVGTEA